MLHGGSILTNWAFCGPLEVVCGAVLEAEKNKPHSEGADVSQDKGGLLLPPVWKAPTEPFPID